MEVNFLEEGDSAYVAGEKLDREIARIKFELGRIGYFEDGDFFVPQIRPPFRSPRKFSSFS